MGRKFKAWGVGLLAAACAPLLASAAPPATGVPQTEKLVFGWTFSRSGSDLASEPGFDDSGWETVRIPHDWSILGPYEKTNPSGGQGGYLPTGLGWYRKTFQLDEVDPAKQYLLLFDASFMNTEVWVNGNKVGERPYGYISFYIDISQELNSGRNTLAVRVDNQQAPNARWYPGCGLYGDVTLISKNKINFDQWGVFVTTPSITAGQATVAVEATLNNGTAKAHKATVESIVLDRAGKQVASTKQAVLLAANGPSVATLGLRIETPELWSPESSALYTLVSSIKIGSKTIDTNQTRFGIRSLRFDPDEGFFLNGKSTKLKGVCEHSDAGLVGSAIPEKVLRRRLRILKEMGCNAIRVSHNPRRPIFYDLCDEMGIMVMDELFDGWGAKSKHDYGRHHFKEWWKTDVKDWVRRDRNHPAVIMYSIGNETGIKDTHNISAEVKKYDTTRPTTGGSLFYGVDVAGFNAPGGTPGILEKFHEENPEKAVVLTEVPHTLQTRGFYRTLTWWRNRSIMVNPFTAYGDKQIFFDGHERYSSSYDNCGVRITARTCWKRTKETPWIMGEFRWTGFDYLGEASFGGGSWPARIWNFGIIDLCGFPKDHYFFYQSQWTDEPMVHLLPHWTHPGMEGVGIPVVAYSNCEEVELFLNGKPLGKKPPRDLLDIVWKVPYEAGTLKAVGYRGGKAVAEKIFKTAGAPTTIEFAADNTNMAADRFDISHLTTTIKDANGNFVPWACNRIDYQIDGPVELLGFDNGDPLDVTTHRETHRKTFNGLSLGIFQSTDQDGAIEVSGAGILGRTLFPESTTVAIEMNRIALRGDLDDARFDITYSVNGSKAVRYTAPFELNETATIKAIIAKNGKPFLTTESTFTKGPLPRITSPNFDTEGSDDPQTFNGPKDKEVVGKWRLTAIQRGKGEVKKVAPRTFDFDGSGSVFTLDGTERNLYGYWWYDYPDDVFENPDDAGVGKLFMYVTDQMCVMKLDSQEAETMSIASRFSTWYFERGKSSGNE
ncbi:Beta-galactosidase BoGH2A [Pontiella desulfatans]|uniref:Beta-galactosidase BoGH2A n=1 Tax=Pontiella desulfatans TaxID=2750659 RepID=A0A6C2U6R1_PONDE|nr:glycoside hydrolase family 2 TIM barrel-domain containing protein [Pontiella desulfatans]VGO15615.1 Beta-galactosidase BoGH2A [Pontiella desulfatans]